VDSQPFAGGRYLISTATPKSFADSCSGPPDFGLRTAAAAFLLALALTIVVNKFSADSP